MYLDIEIDTLRLRPDIRRIWHRWDILQIQVKIKIDHIYIILKWETRAIQDCDYIDFEIGNLGVGHDEQQVGYICKF